MPTRLPPEISIDELEPFRRDPSRWLAAAADIAISHRLPAAGIQPFANGSNLIAALGERLVLKLFPPVLRHQHEAERAALLQLHGRTQVPIPELVIDGERDGWPYLVMTRMPGLGGDVVWPRLRFEERVRLIGEIGALIAEVQAVPPGPLALLEPEWGAFLRGQLAGCRARHARLGLPAHLLADLDRFLGETRQLVPDQPPQVILTGEYIPENFLLLEEAGRWRLSALIDFGDCMAGYGPYDLLGPSTFMAAGRPELVRALLGGFGYRLDEQDRMLARELMTLLLLHRYSDLPRQVLVPGWERCATLDALAEHIWPGT